MKSPYENVNEGHRILEAFRELIELELSDWIPVVVIVLHRLAGIECIMDDHSDMSLQETGNLYPGGEYQEPGQP
ncbi:MAG: hypothetical protein M3H12_13145 [Chromatiales bacterium]|nr:hypothetical protein [Gammaproteobacteria bacterium]